MQFAIFPHAGFDQSVTTPVLVGVLLSWWFTETWGWVFAGLVVPGYLASVFLLDPVGGVVDVGEALVTYALARLIGEHLSLVGLTSRMFGRERFLLVVLTSILVRLAVEAWILPRVAQGAALYSVGLVVVPLAANACWKTGLPRGIVQNGVPTLLTYVVLRFVLAKYTNLSLAGFELAMENVAASFLGSPKAYILLVTGALLAAAANLRYGWDFNGILVPALLGLALFDPLKFASTFIETLTLYALVMAMVRFTPLKRANIEGPRRTVLFFCSDYALRFGLAWLPGVALPGTEVASFMGFGYLLPTLLAVKISQKASAPLILLPTLNVSVAGFALATLIGFGATLADRVGGSQPAPTAPVQKMADPPRDPAAAALWLSTLTLDNATQPDASVTGDLTSIGEVLAQAANGAWERATRGGLSVATLDDGVLLARERFVDPEARRGAPAYLYKARAGERPVVAFVPTPLETPALAAAAGSLVARGEVDAAVISGVEEARTRSPWLETAAHAAARWLARGGTLVTLNGEATPRASNAPSPDPNGAMGRALSAIAKIAPVRPVAVHGNEVLVALDEIAIARALAPERPTVRLDSSVAIAEALRGVSVEGDVPGFEDVLALRKLVLDPLLSAGAAASSRALAPFAARALGYSLSAPSPFGGGGDAISLLPLSRGRSLAVIARSAGPLTRVIEAQGAARSGVRDVALRLAVALDADAVILDVGRDGSFRRGPARAAHAAATAGNVELFVVRDDQRLPSGATISTWMDDGRVRDEARSALEKIGIAPSLAEVDLTTREFAAHTLSRPVPLVTLLVSPAAQRAASLDAALQLRAHLSETSVRSRDGSISDAVAEALAGVDWSAPPAPETIAEATRRAVADGSVVALRTLLKGLRTGSASGVVVRAADTTYLVVVAATTRASRVLVIAPVEGGAPWRIEHRESLDACARSPVVGGVCEVAPS